MLEVIGYLVIPVLVILVVSYFYIEAQKRKAIEEKKKAVILRIATMKYNFKADLKRLVEQQMLTIAGHEVAYKIANNFFVFQPVTPNSVAYCEQLLKSVISAIPTGGPDSINFDLMQEQVNLFVRSLPVAASGYNSAFYRNELPKLIKQLVDSQENRYTVVDENNHDESQEPVSTAA